MGFFDDEAYDLLHIGLAHGNLRSLAQPEASVT
jgi:hypothetical protein